MIFFIHKMNQLVITFFFIVCVCIKPFLFFRYLSSNFLISKVPGKVLRAQTMGLIKLPPTASTQPFCIHSWEITKQLYTFKQVAGNTYTLGHITFVFYFLQLVPTTVLYVSTLHVCPCHLMKHQF